MSDEGKQILESTRNFRKYLGDIRSEHDIKEKIIKPLIESLNSRINRCG